MTQLDFLKLYEKKQRVSFGEAISQCRPVLRCLKEANLFEFHEDTEPGSVPPPTGAARLVDYFTGVLTCIVEDSMKRAMESQFWHLNTKPAPASAPATTAATTSPAVTPTSAVPTVSIPVQQIPSMVRFSIDKKPYTLTRNRIPESVTELATVLKNSPERVKQCRVCGKTFIAKNIRGMYCSHECCNFALTHSEKNWGKYKERTHLTVPKAQSVTINL